MLLLCFILTTLLPAAWSAQCACSTATVLNVRTGPGVSNSIIGTMSNGQCLTVKGSSNGWYKLNYSGRDGWASGAYLNVRTCGGATSSSCPNIVSRASWGSRSATSPSSRLSGTPRFVFIHHGTGPFCSTRAECARIVRSYQNFHVDTRGWSDIGYSFIVGEDGSVFEGRGWDRIGAHTSGYNHNGIGICFIGDFTSRVPNARAVQAVRNLISCGVSQGKISSNYILKGHRDVGATSCPGTALYAAIRSWAHYG